MKTIIMGNSGSGKSTLARRLAHLSGAAIMSLDEVAFAAGAERRPLEESAALAREFMRAHVDWVIEGCYADIIGHLLDECDGLIFLNLGVETCVAHCEARPFEPDKYETAEAQDANLEMLIGWVRSYAERLDEYGLKAHREVFDGFAGIKREYTAADQYRGETRSA